MSPEVLSNVAVNVGGSPIIVSDGIERVTLGTAAARATGIREGMETSPRTSEMHNTTAVSLFMQYPPSRRDLRSLPAAPLERVQPFYSTTVPPWRQETCLPFVSAESLPSLFGRDVDAVSNCAMMNQTIQAMREAPCHSEGSP